MSYTLYQNIKNIEEFLTDDQYDVDGRNNTNEVIFQTFVKSFNLIANQVRYNRGLPFFNLKQNWALIKSQDFTTALTNLQNWLKATDDRYDGNKWNEKHSTKKPSDKKYAGKEAHEKALKILTSDDAGCTIVEADTGSRFVMLQEFEFEINDEDYDSIYYFTGSRATFDINNYIQNLHDAISEVLEEAGMNCVITKAGTIKIYE